MGHPDPESLTDTVYLCDCCDVCVSLLMFDAESTKFTLFHVYTSIVCLHEARVLTIRGKTTWFSSTFVFTNDFVPTSFAASLLLKDNLAAHPF